jgi:hypothetical protein
MVANPKCKEVGCGEWQRPTKTNPAYKGKWSAPYVDNPAYKGEWVPREIPNPAHHKDPAPLTNIGKVRRQRSRGWAGSLLGAFGWLSEGAADRVATCQCAQMAQRADLRSCMHAEQACRQHQPAPSCLSAAPAR